MPGRRNIIISRQAAPTGFTADWVDSVEAALALVSDQAEVMIIGGAELYKQMLPRADRLYLTHIDLATEGDAYFPDYQLDPSWRQICSENFAADSKNPHSYRFVLLEK